MRKELLLSSPKFPRWLPSDPPDYREKWTVGLSDDMFTDGWEGKPVGKPGKIGGHGFGASSGYQTESSAWRFVYEIQPVTVPDPAGGNQSGKL